MLDHFTSWVDSLRTMPIVEKVISGAFERVRRWIMGPLARVVAPAQEAIENARRRLRSGGKNWGKAEMVVIAFLLVQVTPLAVGLMPAMLCSFGAIVTLPMLAFGVSPYCSEAGLSGHALALSGAIPASIALLMLLGWSQAVVNDIQESRAKVFGVPKRATRVLIMGLSEWPKEKGGNTAAMDEAAKWAGRWQEFIKPTVRGGSWQQSLRRIAASLDTLEHVYILPSTESARQFIAFKTYAETIFGRSDMAIRMVTDPEGNAIGAKDASGETILDYEDYDAVSDGLRQALALAAGIAKGLGRSEICVDITAGQKVFSIAGGVLTLNSGLLFSYVATGPEGRAGEVRYYDAELMFSDRMVALANSIKG